MCDSGLVYGTEGGDRSATGQSQRWVTARQSTAQHSWRAGHSAGGELAGGAAALGANKNQLDGKHDKAAVVEGKPATSKHTTDLPWALAHTVVHVSNKKKKTGGFPRCMTGNNNWVLPFSF